MLPVTRDIRFAHRMTWIVVGLLLVSSTAGLLFGADGLYDVSASTFPALIAQDALGLVLVVPVLIWSAYAARHGSVRALVAWMGTLFYVAYFWYFYVIGIKFGPLFVFHIALVSISLYTVLYLFFALDLDELKRRFDDRLPAHWIGGFLMAMAAAFAMLWLFVISTSIADGRDLDATSRYVIAIDSVVLLPLVFLCGVWMWRRDPLGYAVAGLLLVKVAATFLTLIVTTIVTIQWGNVVPIGETVMYGAGLAGAASLLLLCLRSIHQQPLGLRQ